MTPDAVPQPLLAVALDGSDSHGDVEPRRCGRCRHLFEGDPTLDVHGRGDWWLCQACEAAVLPGRARRLAAVAIVGPPGRP